MFKPAAIFFCSALLFLAGCATPPNEPLPPDWSGTNEVHRMQKPPPAKPVTAGAKNTPPPVLHTNLVPATNHFQPPSAPISTWTSLNHWTVAQKLNPPHLLAKSPLTTYAVSSAQGVLVLAIGSREATWNGVEIHLGFAPEMIDDDVFLHGLDLQKNLEPLLCEPPLTFGTNRVIVIDPGHGGRANPGTHSVLDGRLEKEFTLDTALRLKPLLEANGWKVFLTRTTDVDFANSNRVTFATAHHADLFISLHFNATDDRSQQTRGIETYCITPTGLPSSKKRSDYPDPPSAVWPNNAFDAQNLRLAVKLHSALIRATGLDDRGVCRVRYMTVVRGQNCPAVLIENGYLSNPTEAKRIENPDYRQKLAAAIAAALK